MLVHHPGFYQSILDDPSDDQVRLIYSDWLKENREDELSLKLAEFIRVQLELEPYPVVPVFRCSLVLNDGDYDAQTIYKRLQGGINFGPLVFRVYVGLPPYNGSIKVGDIFDFDVATSRVSGLTFRNFRIESAIYSLTEIGYVELTASQVPFHFDRERYDHLLLEQHRLLVSGQDPLFHHLAEIPHTDEDGAPIGPGGRGGMVVWPANERYPSCEFSPRIRQWFRRGFVSKVGIRNENLDYGPDICQKHPIEQVEVVGRIPHEVTSPGYDKFYSWVDSNFTEQGYEFARIDSRLYQRLSFNTFASRASAYAQLNKTAYEYCQQCKGLSSD
jgi:uncharacterized protein (TIGR02996 family)